MSNLDSLFSSTKHDWETPDDLFNAYDDLFHFYVDAAADEKNHKIPRWWGPGGEIEDALQAGDHWQRALKEGNIWLNPPYDRKLQNQFIRRVKLETQQPGYNNIVCLLPARTDTKLFHEVIEPCASVTFLKGRLKFKGASNCAPFPSLIAVF